MGSVQGAAEALAALVFSFLAIVILAIAGAAVQSLFWPGGQRQAVLWEVGMFDSDAFYELCDTLIWLMILLVPALIGLAAMAGKAGGRL